MHDGFELPDQPWDLAARHLVCVGLVANDADAADALAALARGAGLAVHVALEGAAKHRFLDDLHRAAAPSGGDPAGGAAPLDPGDERLLAALAAGLTVTAAAEHLHLSRRTANRRLEAIRAALGVTTTAEAVSRWSERRARR